MHHPLGRFLEHAQDIIILGLAMVLFGLMVRSLLSPGQQVVGPMVDFRPVLGQALFVVVLVELLRLLVRYLGEHHVAVDVMVEASIVATLREVILKGVVELSSATILAVAVLILWLGVLLRFGDLRGAGPEDRKEPGVPGLRTREMIDGVKPTP